MVHGPLSPCAPLRNEPPQPPDSTDEHTPGCLPMARASSTSPIEGCHAQLVSRGSSNQCFHVCSLRGKVVCTCEGFMVVSPSLAGGSGGRRDRPAVELAVESQCHDPRNGSETV